MLQAVPDVSTLDAVVLDDAVLAEAGVPRDAAWLLNYFVSRHGRAFAVYYLKFGWLYDNFGLRAFLDGFRDHTGIFCSSSRCQDWLKLLKDLRRRTDEAAAAADLPGLAALKLGTARKPVWSYEGDIRFPTP